MEEEEEDARLDWGNENFVVEAHLEGKDDFEGGTSFEEIWNAVDERDEGGKWAHLGPLHRHLPRE